MYKKRLGDIHAVTQALELYATSNNGKYPATPTTNGNCATPTCVGSLTSLTTGGYISTLPTDPTYNNTTNNYRYCASGTNDYSVLIRTEGLHPTTWCRPQTGVVSTACGWQTYISC